MPIIVEKIKTNHFRYMYDQLQSLYKKIMILIKIIYRIYNIENM